MKKLTVLLCLGISLFSFNSCQKRVHGCTDPVASNYDETATDNVGCYYDTGGNIQIDTALFVPVITWPPNPPLWHTEIIYNGAITDDAIAEQRVKVFVKKSSEEQWHSLPGEFDWGQNPSCSTVAIYADKYAGRLELIIWDENCWNYPYLNETFDVKTVITD